MVSWPLRVSALERLGVLQAARERLADADAFEAIRQLDRTVDSLQRMERDEIRRAITGEGYHTLWSADATETDAGETDATETDAGETDGTESDGGAEDDAAGAAGA